jgi:hypothetical protein
VEVLSPLQSIQWEGGDGDQGLALNWRGVCEASSRLFVQVLPPQALQSRLTPTHPSDVGSHS